MDGQLFHSSNFLPLFDNQSNRSNDQRILSPKHRFAIIKSVLTSIMSDHIFSRSKNVIAFPSQIFRRSLLRSSNFLPLFDNQSNDQRILSPKHRFAIINSGLTSIMSDHSQLKNVSFPSQILRRSLLRPLFDYQSNDQGLGRWPNIERFAERFLNSRYVCHSSRSSSCAKPSIGEIRVESLEIRVKSSRLECEILTLCFREFLLSGSVFIVKSEIQLIPEEGGDPFTIKTGFLFCREYTGFISGDNVFQNPFHRIFCSKTLEAQSMENERSDIKQRICLLEEELNDFSSENVEIIQYLGRGAYGTVFLFRIRHSKYLYVAKILTNNMPFSDSRILKKKSSDTFKRESLNIPYHPNIANILFGKENVKIETSRIPGYKKSFLAMDEEPLLCGNLIVLKYHAKDLKQFIKERKGSPFRTFSISEIISLVKDILLGLDHLHKNMIVHRDLHPGNIFLDDVRRRVWVGDFGCALDLRNNPSGFSVEIKNEQLYSICASYSDYFRKGGNEDYLPSEIRDCDEKKDQFLDYSKSDIFSLGILAKKLLDSCDEHKNELFNAFNRLFVQRCLEKEIHSRMDYCEAIEVINEFEEKLLENIVS